MPRSWEFELPTRIQFGRGGLKRLGETIRPLGRSALLVGYREQSGLEDRYQRATASLEKTGVAVSCFGVDPEPDAESILDGAAAARDGGIDVVVALGGGSVIDAAKGIAAMARAGGTLWQYTVGIPDAPPIPEALPVVAVPTTAGTGSEVSPVAVFTFRGVGSHPETPLKGTISSAALYPRIAVVDPDLAAGSPPPLTARCGADALG
ncbi:MAG: iron-containing alcohol dehydrogenase, partial [Pirellulales bacterium]|nr:iron-containing alcohol dehydrogenase [Pirellulales bacterium]